MKGAVAAAFLAALPAASPVAARAARPAAEDEATDRIARSVVRIFTAFRKANTYQPWQMDPEDSMTGTGCILAGRRILTNAHVVSDRVYIQVRKAGDPKKYTAKVEFAAHDAELALLTVDDPAFFKDTEPLALGGLPRQRDKVAAYGFPVGGEELSVSEGIVSRIEVTDYAHSGRGLLTIQTDAAINPGNSGGPAVMDGKLIGITFQMEEDAQKIGYIVPTPIVERFLADVNDGTYDGVPDLGVRFQNLENESLRAFVGMRPDETGVRVATVVYGSSAWGRLNPGDVLVSIDGVRIAGDGTVPLRKERVLFTHLLTHYQAGEKARVGILRSGRRLELQVPMLAMNALVGGPAYDARPTYFVYGGLVFTPLTHDYVDNWDYSEVGTPLKFYLELGLPTPARAEIVLLGHVLPHDVNVGYQDFRGVVVESVNGRRVSGMRDLIEAFAHPQGRYQVVETDRLTDFGSLIVLDAAAAAKANGEILARYGIPSDRSPDLARKP